MTQSIDCGMNLGTLFALMAVVTSASSAFRGGLKGSSIKDHRRRFRVPAGKQPQHLAQIRGPWASKQPALIQRWACCWTLYQGGRSWGITLQGQPARTI